MSDFTDTAGRQWRLRITLGTAMRVKERAGVNLMTLDWLDQIGEDPLLLCNVLFAIVEPQAEASGVSDVAFGEALEGDVIEEATEAFLEALVNFTPSRKRRLLQGLIEKLRSVGLMMEQRAEKALAELEIPGESSGNAPASAE